MIDKQTNKQNPLAFAKKHPVITFLLITFTWTWLFWLAAIPFRSQNNLMVTAMVLIGGFGPAIGGILSLGMKHGLKFSLSLQKLVTWGLGSAIIFGLFTLRYFTGNIGNFDTLAADLTITVPILVAAVVASLAGGWVISSAVSDNLNIRSKMASMLPWRSSIGWTILALVFYTVMVLISWGLAEVLGLPVEYPGLWGRDALEVLPILGLTFLLTAFAQGGLEEPGWRGMMQPTLQKRFSPLSAALIVSVAWSLWHLPLYLNGFYGGELIGGMIGGGIFRILLSIFLAWFYNRSGGNLLAMIILHTSFNMVVNFLPTSDLGLLVLWLIVVLVIVFKDKMYQRQPES